MSHTEFPKEDFLPSLARMHLCVLLWGFTAILGKLIQMPASNLVLWRMGLVTLAAALWPRARRACLSLTRTQAMQCGGIGILVALHWLCFYGAIKLSNASVAATCMAFAPVFLALLEPLLRKRRFQWQELTIAGFAIPGVFLVVGGVPAAMEGGIWLGALAAGLAAVFSLANKGLASRVPAIALTGVEIGAGFLFLAILLPITTEGLGGQMQPSTSDLLWLVVLAYACTLLPFALSVVALRGISAFAAQLSVNLEPVYTIAIAALLFQEQNELTPRFYAGVAILLAGIAWHAWSQFRAARA